MTSFAPKGPHVWARIFGSRSFPKPFSSQARCRYIAVCKMSVSAEEVAKHNKDSDCWVIVGDQVLDVTAFLSHLDIYRLI